MLHLLSGKPPFWRLFFLVHLWYDVEMKICNRCKKELPFSEFTKDKDKKDGYRTICKTCTRQYRQDHKEEERERNRQYYQNHKEERKEYNRQYHF
jgi:hypothetical protein